MLEPRGIGTVVRAPVAFVIVMLVSSATLFGMLGTGGNIRSVSLSTLRASCVSTDRQGRQEGRTRSSR